MTTHDKLTKIRAKCEDWIKAYEGSPIPSAKAAVAGWRATIAAIDRLENPASWWIPHYGGHQAEFAAYLVINQILAAWPDELLED